MGLNIRNIESLTQRVATWAKLEQKACALFTKPQVINSIKSAQLKLAPLKPDTLEIIDNFKLIKDESTYIFTDKYGNRLCHAIFGKNDTDSKSLILYDIVASKKNCGYGTKMIKKLQKDFISNGKHDEIVLTACLESGNKPPHKFYLDNGFVAKDNSVQNQLLKWIQSGAKRKDFPPECDCCEMIFR